jgi:hypothetical protein
MSTHSLTSADPATPTNTLNLPHQPGKSRERLLAEVALSPTAMQATTIQTFSKGTVGTINLTDAVQVMKDETKLLRAGDLSHLEDRLLCQAVALDTIFTECARRAAVNMGEYMQAVETYLRLALKAQAQSRATLQTLADMKSPRMTAYVQQANIAHGPQQVNNTVAPSLPGDGGQS